SMTTVWHGNITPRRPRRPVELPVVNGAQALRIDQGAEMGRFNMGSTVILVMPPGTTEWRPEMKAGGVIRMGQALARVVLPT
ncbi:MAG: phosphatidylserine decarboxylase, partial [Gammaproteobacteria bacterium]